LLALYRHDLRSLVGDMAAYCMTAVGDLHPGEPGDLWRRFVSWARRALFLAAEQRQRSERV
jgi:hypothetical protein